MFLLTAMKCCIITYKFFLSLFVFGLFVAQKGLPLTFCVFLILLCVSDFFSFLLFSECWQSTLFQILLQTFLVAHNDGSLSGLRGTVAQVKKSSWPGGQCAKL